MTVTLSFSLCLPALSRAPDTWAPEWAAQPTVFLSSSVYQNLREERVVHDRRSQPLKNLAIIRDYHSVYQSRAQVRLSDSLCWISGYLGSTVVCVVCCWVIKHSKPQWLRTTTQSYYLLCPANWLGSAESFFCWPLLGSPKCPQTGISISQGHWESLGLMETWGEQSRSSSTCSQSLFTGRLPMCSPAGWLRAHSSTKVATAGPF